MHELSLCRDLLAILERSAAEEGFSRIRRVRLQVGVLAAVDVAALRFAFEVASRGGLADGASLLVESALARAECLACGEGFECNDYLAHCPRCGGERLRLDGGDGMRIIDLEVE